MEQKTKATPNTDELDRKQIRELFDKLDKDKNGKIEFHELNEYFNQVNSQSADQINSLQVKHDQNAKRVFELITNKKDGGENQINFDFRDFVDYVNQTDKKIELTFKDLDRDKNGIIDYNEIKSGFENLGIILSDAQINKLMSHIDKNNSLQIDWQEWRDFFRFAPHDKMEEALRHWRTETFLGVDGDQSIPIDYTAKEKKTGLWWRNLVAGGAAGALSRTCTAPLDRVKIFLQVHGTESKIGIVGATKSMVKEGGIRSLWRGNLINVLKITPESAIKFAAYEQIKTMMGQDGAQLPPFQKFLSGTMAGFIAQSTIYPMEVLKTRLALRKSGQYNGISDCVRKIYKNEGIKAFYRGYLMNTLGIAAIGIEFSIYETLKNKYKALYPDNPYPSTLAVLCIANTASTAAMYSMYPIGLIRTRLQSSTNPKETISSIATSVYKRDGFFGFYRGSFANLTKVAPAASIGYIAYENFSHLLGVSKS